MKIGPERPSVAQKPRYLLHVINETTRVLKKKKREKKGYFNIIWLSDITRYLDDAPE